jgi:hypothetical protein
MTTASAVTADLATRNAAPQCSFHVRTPAGTEPPTYHYDTVYVRGKGHGQTGTLVTPYPPAIGDLIFLHDEMGAHTGTHRVVDRAWSHSTYGSANWPVGTKWPSVGPILNIIVVPEPGPFRDEADRAEEPED